MIPMMETVISLKKRYPRISYQDIFLAKISQNQNLINKISHFVGNTLIRLKDTKVSYKHIYFISKILVILNPWTWNSLFRNCHKGTSINDVPRFSAIFDLPTLSYSTKSHFGSYLWPSLPTLISDVIMDIC